MQRKAAAILLLIVLLPVGLFAWLGLRMVHNEQQVAAAQVQALVQTQLGTVDDAVNAYFRALQDEWLNRLQGRQLDTQAFKNLPQELGLVQQVLVLGADGKRVYPVPGAVLSEADKQFMQRTAAIWDNPSLLTQGAALAVAASGTSSSLVAKLSGYQSFSKRAVADSAEVASSASADAGPAQSGWYTWHWNAELHHIFWLRDTQGRLVGLELSPVALVSDIIALLPSTAAFATAGESTSTRLINGNGQTVYEWGDYRPGEKEKSLAMRPLSHPLGTWKLEYFGPAIGGGAAASNWAAALALLGLAVALSGLAWYLYREHSREVRLAQQRVNFVNQVSHELKTPLTNIRLYAELLEGELEPAGDDAAQESGVPRNAPDRPDSNRKAHKYLGVITAESLRLSRLIANVLRLGQFQKAQFTLALQPGRVDEVVQRCVAAFKPALDAKHMTVECDNGDSGEGHEGGMVMLDAQALEQILNNLLSNAEKYASSGGAVHITTTQADGISTITVRDFGPGIAERERARVFEPFYRVSSKLTDGVAGTGIGLDIARQLARQHGGDVTLCDVGRVGVNGAGRVPTGACFLVTLRTAAVEPQV